MFRHVFPSALLAGLCISIGCIVYLRTGGVAGAALFAFGLTTVVYYGMKLYTGTAGFIRARGDWAMLATVLAGNIVGCLLSALAARYALPDCAAAAGRVLEGRLAKGPLACGLLAVACGFMMTTAVHFARQGKMLPLLLGVPAFIMAGFTHSIADAFYFLASPWSMVLTPSVLAIYLAEVVGNFVGCNLYRWTMLMVPKGPAD